MSEQLLQHIYTSTARMNFETVAVSPGVSEEILKQLEARAQSYPMKSAWGDAALPPPYVVRGFRLVGDGKEDFAINLSFYVGRSLSSPEGNYLSHSYVIPRSLLAQHGYNLPWLAACLPCHVKYYPARGFGADTLAPLAFNLDPARQFTLFSFVARELTEAGLHDLVGRLVVHAESNGPEHTLDLELPPPHARLGEIHQEVMGKPPNTAPGPDALRLLRLAGALAILPDAFKQNLTFIVNDGVLAAGRINPDAYAVRVARSQSAVLSEVPASWPWLDHCRALAADNQLEELSALRAWLSRLLPSGCRPSRLSLDVSFAFYQFMHQRPTAEGALITRRAPSIQSLVEQVYRFKKCNVEVDGLYEILLPLLEPQEISYADRCELYVILSEVAASSGEIGASPPPRIFEAVKDCLILKPGADKIVHQQFWRRLPEIMKSHLWEKTYVEEQPPGRVPMDDDGRPDPYYLNFALTSFEPGLLRKNIKTRGQITRHLAECLMCPVAGAGSFYQGQWRSQLSRFLSGLYVLLNLKVCDSELLKELLNILAGEFCSVVGRSERGEELRQVVLGALKHVPGLNMLVLAECTHMIATRDVNAVFTLLRGLSLEPEERRQSRDFLSALRGCFPDVRLQPLILALQEMGEVLDRPELIDTERKLELVLQHLYTLQVQLKQSHQSGELLMDVQRTLLPALRRLPTVDRFNVGAAYLFVFAPEDVGLFNDLLDVLSEHGAQIAAWCIAEHWKMPQGRGRALARFLRVADHFGPKPLQRAYEQAEHAWRSLKDIADRRALLSQLKHYLKHTEASRDLKNYVQDEFDRLSVKRGR